MEIYTEIEKFKEINCRIEIYLKKKMGKKNISNKIIRLS